MIVVDPRCQKAREKPAVTLSFPPRLFLRVPLTYIQSKSMTIRKLSSFLAHRVSRNLFYPSHFIFPPAKFLRSTRSSDEERSDRSKDKQKNTYLAREKGCGGKSERERDRYNENAKSTMGLRDEVNAWEKRRRWRRAGPAVCIEPRPVSSQTTYPPNPTAAPISLLQGAAYPPVYVGRVRSAHREAGSAPCTAEPVMRRCHRRYTRARTCRKQSRGAQPGSVFTIETHAPRATRNPLNQRFMFALSRGR